MRAAPFGRRRRRCGRLCGAGSPALRRARHVGEEARVVAGGEPWRRVGDGIEQRIEPGRIGLGEVVQHVAQHLLLGAGMADADAHAGVFVADMGVIERRPLWPALPPPVLTLSLAGGQVELVVEDVDVVAREILR